MSDIIDLAIEHWPDQLPVELLAVGAAAAKVAAHRRPLGWLWRHRRRPAAAAAEVAARAVRWLSGRAASRRSARRQTRAPSRR